MSHERQMGFMRGLTAGAALIAGYFIHPMMLAFVVLAVWFNYSWGVKAR